MLPTEFHVIALLMTQKPNSASMQFNRFMESQMLAIMETGIIHILGTTDLFALHKANLIYYTYPKASKRKRHPISILRLLFSAVQMQKSVSQETSPNHQTGTQPDKGQRSKKSTRAFPAQIHSHYSSLVFLTVSTGFLWFPWVSPL